VNRWKRVGECKRCGACCLYLWYEVPSEWEAKFWKVRGAVVVPDPFNPKNIIVGANAPCQHIHRNAEGTYTCDIHGTDEYPKTCADYPFAGPNSHFACIKKALGCGYDYITEEIKEEKKMPITYKLPQEEADRLLKDYTKRAHDVYQGLLNEAGVPGCFIAQQIFREMVQEAERRGGNLITLDTFNDKWMENFKENLMAHEFDGFDKGRWIARDIEGMTGGRFLCVGAGPSLTDEQIEMMKKFNGIIICTNKSARRLYEHGIIPTIITCIHGTNEVLPSFQNDIVRENLHKSHVVLATDVTRDLIKEVKAHCDPTKLWFFHSSIPSELVTNIDQFFQAMVDVPVLDTGGNVGLFNIALSQRFMPKAVGFVGMELCQSFEEAVTNNQDMLESTLLRFPDDNNQEFVLSKVFRGYTQVIMNWYGDWKKQNNDVFPFEIINCTPRGLIYIRRDVWIPYMPLEEFIAKHGV
jgi:hypothetical protein